jgi:hypothetical protein
MTPEIVETLITIIAVSGVSGVGTLFNNKKITKLEQGQRSISAEVASFRTTYEANQTILKNLAFSCDANKKINQIVIESTHYLDPHHDLHVAALIAINGEAAKDSIKWAIENSLSNISFNDYLIQYEALSVVLRDQMSKLEPDYVETIRMNMAFKGKKMLSKIRDIIEDEVPNSKVIRFCTAVESIFQEITTEIIRSRIKFNSQIKNN